MTKRTAVVEGSGLFGTTVQLTGAGVSTASRAKLPIQLVVSLLYLKHAVQLQR